MKNAFVFVVSGLLGIVAAKAAGFLLASSDSPLLAGLGAAVACGVVWYGTTKLLNKLLGATA